jgi:hypothetical protein
MSFGRSSEQKCRALAESNLERENILTFSPPVSAGRAQAEMQAQRASRKSKNKHKNSLMKYASSEALV